MHKDEDIFDNYLFLDNHEGLQGSFSVVKKAFSKIDGEHYAIKCINRNENMNIEQINNEIKYVRNLIHPNIVKIYDSYIYQEYIMIVFEWMDVTDLFDKISNIQNYTEQDCCNMFRKLVDAVRYCHKNKIVHRDLKVIFCCSQKIFCLNLTNLKS